MRRFEEAGLFGIILYLLFGVFILLFFLLKLYYKLLWRAAKFVWKKLGGKTKKEIDLCH